MKRTETVKKEDKTQPKKKVKIQEFTEFTITNGGSFVRMLELMANFISAPVDLLLSEKGLSVNALSSDHVCLLLLRLDAAYFERFECPKSHHVGISLGTMVKILKGLKDEPLSFRIPIESNKMYVAFKHNNLERNYELNALDLTVENMEPDGFDACVTADILAATWLDIVKECDKFDSDSVKMQVDQEKMLFHLKTSAGETSIIKLKGTEAPQLGEAMIWGDMEFEETISARYMKFIKPPTGQFEIAFSLPKVVNGQECAAPIRFQFPIRNNDGLFEVYVSPKIADEDA